MRRLCVTRSASLLTLCLALGAHGFAPAMAQQQNSEQPSAAPQQPFVAGIAAIVNQNVITLRQLDTETRSAAAQLQQQNIPLPDMDTLRRQVLQRMIMLEL